jgi:hypothetical protein
VTINPGLRPSAAWRAPARPLMQLVGPQHVALGVPLLRLIGLSAPSGKKQDRLPVRVAEHNVTMPGPDGKW